MFGGKNVTEKQILPISVISIIIGALLLALAFFDYNATLARNLERHTYSNLKELAENQVSIIKEKINNERNTLNAAAQYIGTEISSEEVINVLNTTINETDFLMVGYIDKYGNAVRADGRTNNLYDMAYVRKALSGEDVIAYTHVRPIDKEARVAVLVPIKSGESVTGALMGTFDGKELNKYLFSSGFEGRGHFYLCDKKGNIISASANEKNIGEGDNVFEFYNSETMKKGDDARSVKEKISEEKEGTFFFSSESGQRYVIYSPIGNGWYIFNSISTEEAKGIYSFASEDSRRLILKGLIILVALMCIIIWTGRKEKKYIREAYILKDSAGRKLEMALAQTPRMIIEYDMASDKAYVSNNYINGDVYHVGYSFSEFRRGGDFVYSEDREIHMRLIERVRNNDRDEEGYIKEYARYTLDGGKEYRWCYVTGEKAAGETADSGRALFVFEDVHEDLEEQIKINKKAITDPLTGLFNKAESEVLVQRSLDSYDERGFLFMIDIDKFKNINDTLGHAQGDYALKRIAAIIRDTFRSRDITGRVGGDEFLAFMACTDDREQAAKHGQKILDEVRAIDTKSKEIPHFTCSIGIAESPQDGKAFDELYKKADHAMYLAKAQSGNNYKFAEK